MDEKNIVNAEILVIILGIFVSALALYIPIVNTRYARLESNLKRVIMLIALVIATYTIACLSCLGWWTWLFCEQQGLWLFIEIFVLLLIGSQVGFLILPRPAAVRAALAEKYYDDQDQIPF